EALANGGRLDRAETVRIVAEAAVVDLRGRRVLPDLLRVIDSAPVTDPALADAVARLRAWERAGAKREETSPGSRRYAHADAIRIMDAWWPKLVAAQFRPGLGDELYRALVDALQIDEPPSGLMRGDVTDLPVSANETQPHRGSAFQFGWWGYLSKDLRAVLGDPVQAPLPRRFCGDGTVAGCRAVLLDSLADALAEPATVTYPGDEVCAAGDQWCADAVRQAPLGGIGHPLISWQNRPTYQQVVSFPARRGEEVGNLAKGAAATASSRENLLHPPGKAVDGDLSSRWSSAYRDGEWIQVDLGA